MAIREQFRMKLKARLERQRSEALARRGPAHERWHEESERYRRQVEAMKPVFAAIREIQEAADIEYKKHGCDSLTVEGVHVRVHVTKTKAIYMFGDRPNVKRYLTLDDALEALTDHLAEAVARRMFH